MTRISARLNEITLKKNIPLSVTVELTYRCPLSCVHCYLPQTHGLKKPLAGREMKTSEWKKAFKEFREEGCLYMVFTGGEPLLRDDLGELCSCAVDLGFSVKVFTTGIGVNEKFLSVIRGFPLSFEISVYGREETHDGITGLAGSFRRSLAAAGLFKRMGFGVKIKTPLMKHNWRDACYLLDLAERNGFGVSFDIAITSMNDGNLATLKWRLDPEEMEKIMEDARLGLLPETGKIPAAASDFICSAGRNAFAVNPYGDIVPCLELPLRLDSLRRKTFADIWRKNEWLVSWRKLRMKNVRVCGNCEEMPFCNRCPGMALLEDGDLMGPSSFACLYAGMLKKFSTLDKSTKSAII